jgi:hypothetical protein
MRVLALNTADDGAETRKMGKRSILDDGGHSLHFEPRLERSRQTLHWVAWVFLGS